MQCQKLKTYIESGRVVFLPPKLIRANPAQPRQVFDQEALAELSASIRQHGILQPLSVRRVGTGYELVAGERRLRAALLAGLPEVPCIVMQMDDRNPAWPPWWKTYSGRTWILLRRPGASAASWSCPA